MLPSISNGPIVMVEGRVEVGVVETQEITVSLLQMCLYGSRRRSAALAVESLFIPVFRYRNLKIGIVAVGYF